MPVLAERNRSMPASPIRKLAPYAEAARARGLSIYGLNIGQPDLPTPPQYFEAIHKANIRTLAYAPSDGYLSYRSKLAQYYKRFGIQVRPDEILVTCGASEALMFAFLACFNPGDELLIPEPLYANYIGFAVQLGVKIVPIPTRIQHHFKLPEVQDFELLLTPRTKGILLCNPSNPTGQVFGRKALEDIAKVVKANDLYLIADEVYKEFLYDDEEFVSTLALPGLEENVIMVDSISKRWSCCGARLGNLVTRNRTVLGAAMKYAQARLSPPTLAQIGAEALLDLPDSYYQEVRATYTLRRNLVVDALNSMAGVMCPRSSGAFYVMARLPVEDTEHFCIWMLENFEVEGHTLMLAPGAGFYSTPQMGRNEARIAYVLDLHDLSRAMELLDEALHAYPERLRESAIAQQQQEIVG